MTVKWILDLSCGSDRGGRVERLVSVREFMSRPPVALDSTTSVADACKLMGQRHIGSVLVSHNGVTHGIFTERDLMSKVLLETRDLTSLNIGRYASSPLVTVSPSTDVKEAARVMTELKVRRLVVVENGKPIGMFTSADLARAVGKFPLDL
jgi:signal-transduction protein with cAMP-binding, CBS, and nucleotidyltransferase domain